MTQSDISTAIDDERRKSGTSFIAAAEKTRYMNQALMDISRNIDLDDQEDVNDFTFAASTGTSAVDALSSVCPNYKDGGAIISITSLSSSMTPFSRVRPEDFDQFVAQNINGLDYLTPANTYCTKGSYLYTMYNGNSGDTLRVRYYNKYVAKTSGASLSSSITASTDEPIFGETQHEAVVQFVLWKVFKKEGKRDDAAESKKRYDEFLKDIIASNATRRAGIYDRIYVET